MNSSREERDWQSWRSSIICINLSLRRRIFMNSMLFIGILNWGICCLRKGWRLELGILDLRLKLHPNTKGEKLCVERQIISHLKFSTVLIYLSIRHQRPLIRSWHLEPWSYCLCLSSGKTTIWNQWCKDNLHQNQKLQLFIPWWPKYQRFRIRKKLYFKNVAAWSKTQSYSWVIAEWWVFHNGSFSNESPNGNYSMPTQCKLYETIPTNPLYKEINRRIITRQWNLNLRYSNRQRIIKNSIKKNNCESQQFR